MNYSKSGVLCILLILFIAAGCGTNEIKKQSIFDNTQFDPQIGVKHNAIVTDALLKANISRSNSYNTNLDNLNSYFLRTHKVDVSAMPAALFGNKANTLSARVTIDDFDPYAFIDKYQNNYSVAFASILKKVISDMEDSTQDSTQIKKVISGYIADVKNNKFGLDQGETNELLNMLTVMDSSASLWYSQIAGSNSSGRAEYTASTDAWKIVVTDGISGAAGALGGPIGALVGLAAGSLNSWISML